jgi:tRNA(Ile2) C34 agmatinyltransferase TiaS
MSIIKSIENSWKEEESFNERNQLKIGPYENPENGCPNCGRHRIMKGDDNKHRCEKCYWCIEDNAYDNEFSDYMS